MKQYQKPIVLVNEELAEGVYTASGVADNNNGPKCDSKYMKGEWQGFDFSTWPTTYKQQQGCNGCPAFRSNGCGLKTDYVDSGYASSYDVDNGNRMPGWEKEGHKADDIITY